MTTTFTALKTRVAVKLQDPDMLTFTDPLIAELVQAALIEVGIIAPDQFTEDIQPIANQLTYTVREDDFPDGIQEVEVMRVEVWDASAVPQNFISSVTPAGSETSRGQDSGWYVWNGILNIPTRFARGLVDHENDYVIRVWGYSPYVQPVDGSDVINVSAEVEQAMVWYATVEALEMLLASRDLFSQWQTRSGNSDISPAMLMNQKATATNEWRIRSRKLTRLRSEV